MGSGTGEVINKNDVLLENKAVTNFCKIEELTKEKIHSILCVARAQIRIRRTKDGCCIRT